MREKACLYIIPSPKSWGLWHRRCCPVHHASSSAIRDTTWPLCEGNCQCTHLAHDDGTIDGQLQVFESAAHDADDPLHAVNLLPQEDVHGSDGTHLLQPSLHLVRDVVPRQLVQHLLGLLVDDALSGLPTTTGAVLGLDGEDGVQTLVGRVALVPAVGGGKEHGSQTPQL